MKRNILIFVGILILIGVILIFVRGQEDTWIKDSRGVWVKHGNPRNKPAEVSQQEELIQKAVNLYSKAQAKGTDLSVGPCLGQIDSDWVVDIAHSPRETVDNLPVNQCRAYLDSQAHHFIELDPSGEIIKIN